MKDLVQYGFILSWFLFGLLTAQWYIWLFIIPTILYVGVQQLLLFTIKDDPRWKLNYNRDTIAKQYIEKYSSYWQVITINLSYKVGALLLICYMGWYTLTPLFGIVSK